MSSVDLNDRPPLFKTWAGWYWLLAGITLVQLLIYFYLTVSFNHTF
jgi:hypothetical protein